MMPALVVAVAGAVVQVVLARMPHKKWNLTSQKMWRKIFSMILMTVMIIRISNREKRTSSRSSRSINDKTGVINLINRRKVQKEIRNHIVGIPIILTKGIDNRLSKELENNGDIKAEIAPISHTKDAIDPNPAIPSFRNALVGNMTTLIKERWSPTLEVDTTIITMPTIDMSLTIMPTGKMIYTIIIDMILI